MIKVYQTKLNVNMDEEDRKRYIKIMLGMYTPVMEELSDVYEQTCEFDCSVKRDNINELLESLMRYLNMDNRPNGKYHKSLSVGDIICIDGDSYICRTLGFEKVNLDMSNVGKNDWILRESF